MSDKLALNGGAKAVGELGPYPSKIGREELEELTSLWGFSPKGRKKLLAAIRGEKNLRGPHLFRYYNPRPSKVEEAEKRFAKFIGVKHCLAVNSCTSALIAAMRALGIGMGDEVIVPAYTFFATASTVGACNAIPVIADVDETLTLDPRDVERKITPRTRAIAVVHMRGMPARMDKLTAVARKHKVAIIEDVAQAAGGSYKGRMLGSIGTIGCFSFDYYKVLNSGEGGFVTTNDEWLYTRAQSWHDCAACWRPDRYGSERREGELFCGENYRMSELQAAVAAAQLTRLEGIAAKRARLGKILTREISGLPGIIPHEVHPENRHVCWFYMFRVVPEELKCNRSTFTKALTAEGVRASGGYIKVPLYGEPVFQNHGFFAGRWPVKEMGLTEMDFTKHKCPNAESMLTEGIRVYIYEYMTEEYILQVAAAIKKVARHFAV